MASQGPLFPSVGADDAGVGTVAWTTPENITADDNTRATRSLTQNVTSHYLKSSSYGFSIPAGATIDGIVVEVDRSQSGTSPLRDNQVRIVKADGTVGATNKADTVNNWPTTPDVTVSYGSATDLWGETWAPADINDPDFGAAIAARNTGATASTARVDFIRITVYYTAAPASYSRDTADTASADDAVSRSQVAARPVADSAPASDSSARQMVRPRAVADSSPASDALARRFVGARSLPEAVSGLDAVARSAAVSRATSETASAADAIALFVSGARAIFDSAPAADAVSYELHGAVHSGFPGTFVPVHVGTVDRSAAGHVAATSPGHRKLAP